MALLDLIYQLGPVSQKALSDLTGLRTSTVSVLLKPLKEAELISLSGKGISGVQGGKKADLLTLNGASGLFSGLYLQNHAIERCLIDLSGEIHDRLILPVEEFSPSWFRRTLCEIIRQDRKECSAYRGAGIAVKSAVNLGGDVIVSPGFPIRIPGLAADLQRELGALPLAVENDANCSAHYLYRYYRGEYANIMVFFFNLDPFSVGTGLILNGSLFKGGGGCAGEIWRSDRGPYTGKGLGDDLVRRGRSPGEYLDEAEQFLVEKILTFALFLDMTTVVLSGATGRLGEERLERIRRAVKENSLVEEVLIDGTDSPVLGAVKLAEEQYLKETLKQLNKGGV